MAKRYKPEAKRNIHSESPAISGREKELYVSFPCHAQRVLHRFSWEETPGGVKFNLDLREIIDRYVEKHANEIGGASKVRRVKRQILDDLNEAGQGLSGRLKVEEGVIYGCGRESSQEVLVKLLGRYEENMIKRYYPPLVKPSMKTARKRVYPQEPSDGLNWYPVKSPFRSENLRIR